MSLIIGDVLPLRDRVCAKAVIDGRTLGVYDRVMEEIMALPHGSVIDLVQIVSSYGYVSSVRLVRCDGTENSMVRLGGSFSDDVPEKIQESGVWAVRQLQDGFRAVAHDPDAESVDDVMGELYAMIEEKGAVAGLPPLSMIEVHGPVEEVVGSASGSRVMERRIVVIGEDGQPLSAPMTSVMASGETKASARNAASPGEILKAMLARSHAGKDLEEAEAKWRGSRWRSPCPRPGSCR